MNTSRKAFWQKPIVVLILATIVISVTYGTRQSFGMFMLPITIDFNWGREELSFAIAIQNIVYGLAAPLVGAIADRWGPIKVLVASAVLYTIGLLLMGQSSTPEGMVMSIGLFTGIGASGCALPMLLSVVGRVAPENKRTMWFGIVTSGGTAGQMFIVPFIHGAIQSIGWVSTTLMMAVMVALIIPIAATISSAAAGEMNKKDTQSLGQVINQARTHSGFWLLTVGFFVCGLQVNFITAHLPAYLAESPVGAAMGAIAISLIGFFNMLGTWTAGWLGGKYRKKRILSAIYAARSLVILGFVTLPLSETSVVIFSAMVGFLWLATVPLTSGIVVQIFGPRYLATLYGVVFLSHQLGSFLGIWFGGRLFDQTGSYDIVWYAIVIAGFVAAALHYPINDKPLARVGEAPA